MHGTFVRVNAVLHKYRDPRLCFPPPNCQGVSISGSAAHQPTSMACSFDGLLSWPFDGHEMPFRREVHVFLWLSLSLYGAWALEESAFTPCAQEGFAQPEPVQRCPARASVCWLPLCFPGSASGVLFFLSVPFTPGTVLPWAALCEPSMGCEVVRLVAWGCIHPSLSPLHLSCSNPISRAIAVWLYPGASILLRLLCPVLVEEPQKVPWGAYQMVWCEWQEPISHCQITIFKTIFITVEFHCKETL